VISRRACLLAIAAAGLPDIGYPGVRLLRSDLGHGTIWMHYLRVGDVCAIHGDMVRWRGHLLGFLPSGFAGTSICRISNAAFDVDGMTDIHVRLCPKRA
jgi:hypothetical protein